MVRKLGADHHGPVVGVRHAQELRLSAGHAAVEFRIAEESRAFFVGMNLSSLTLGLEPPFAHPAVSAGNVEGDDHAIPYLHPCNCRTGFLNYAHGFMSQDVS